MPQATQTKNPDELLTIKQIADENSITASAVDNWIYKYGLKHQKIAGARNIIVIKRSDLEAFQKQRDENAKKLSAKRAETLRQIQKAGLEAKAARGNAVTISLANVFKMATQICALIGKSVSLTGTDQVKDFETCLTKIGEEVVRLRNENDALKQAKSAAPQMDKEFLEAYKKALAELKEANTKLGFHTNLVGAAKDLIEESDRSQSMQFLQQRRSLRRVLEWMGEITKKGSV